MMDYSEEPRGIFLVIDNKSFYATVECTMRGLDPLTTPLVVMSEAENTNSGLVLASSPMAKKLYGISNVNRQRDLCLPRIAGDCRSACHRNPPL